MIERMTTRRSYQTPTLPLPLGWLWEDETRQKYPCRCASLVVIAKNGELTPRKDEGQPKNEGVPLNRRLVGQYGMWPFVDGLMLLTSQPAWRVFERYCLLGTQCVSVTLTLEEPLTRELTEDGTTMGNYRPASCNGRHT